VAGRIASRRSLVALLPLGSLGITIRADAQRNGYAIFQPATLALGLAIWEAVDELVAASVAELLPNQTLKISVVGMEPGDTLGQVAVVGQQPVAQGDELHGMLA
jgi:hypothetical protein